MKTQNQFPDLWWLLLLQGISAIVLGFLLLTQPVSTTEVIVVFVGAYWLVSGIFAIVRIFTAAGRAHWGWSLLIGVIGVLAGLFVLRHPLISMVILPTTLVIVLAIQGILMGVFDLVRGFQGDGAGAYVMGVLNILIGLWLWFNPLAAALSLPFVLGIFGLVGGVFLTYQAFQLRKQAA
ncbi:MAG: HdeD family acid-resistance protein [Chloroflexota bacterium]